MVRAALVKVDVPHNTANTMHVEPPTLMQSSLYKIYRDQPRNDYVRAPRKVDRSAIILANDRAIHRAMPKAPVVPLDHHR